MKKVFKIEEIDCPNCAAKIEEGINGLDGVSSATVNFITQKMIIETDDSVPFDRILKQVEKVAKKVERRCVITEQ